MLKKVSVHTYLHMYLCSCYCKTAIGLQQMVQLAANELLLVVNLTHLSVSHRRVHSDGKIGPGDIGGESCQPLLHHNSHDIAV